MSSRTETVATKTITPEMAQALGRFLGNPSADTGDFISPALVGGTVSLESDGSIRIKVADQFIGIERTKEETLFPQGAVKTKTRHCHQRDPLPPGIILQVWTDGINYPWKKPDCTKQVEWAFINPEKVMALKGAIFGFQDTCPTEVVQAQAESLRQAMGL